MTFAGLPLSVILGVAGAAGAVTVVLYILKLRRRPIPVPFAPLWHRALGDRDSSRLFSKLRRWLSLALQLLLIALLALALGDPRPTKSLGSGKNLVLLIDASASMQATDERPTRLQAAKVAAKNLVRGLGGSDRALIVQMGPVPVPLSTMSDDATDLLLAVDRVRAADTHADLGRALGLAADALRGLPNGQIVVLSDGALPPLDPAPALGGATLRFVPLGSSGKNLALTAFSVRRYPLDKSRLEVMAELANLDTERAEVELSLFGDGAIVDSERMTLEPGARLARFFPDVGGARHALEARLRYADGHADALPADDRAYALVPERRRAKVLVVTAGNTYLEAALLLDEYLDVTDVRPAKYLEKAKEKWDVIIFDRATPAEMPKAHAFYIDPRGPGSPVKVDDKPLKQPGFDKIERKHPTVRYTALGEVNIAAGHRLIPEQGDKAVGLFQQDKAIMVAGQRNGYKFVALGFDLRESDFPLRIAWPLVLLNSINWFMDEDAKYLSSFRTGDVWRVPVASVTTQAKLKMPDGATELLPVHEGRAVYLGERAGFYELTVDDASGAQVGATSFAANLLDIDESSITPADELVVDGKAAGEVGGFQIGVRREIWIYLLLAAAILTALEWATYHRRLTV